MSEFEVVEISSSQFDWNDELEGIVPKAWIAHPSFGHVLFKQSSSGENRLGESRSDWSEKICSSLNELLSLPAAKYELAILKQNGKDIPGSISLDVSDTADAQRYSLEDLLHHSLSPYNFPEDYTVDNVIEALSQNDIGLPPHYHVPDGITDGVDFFVGIMMFDSWIGNGDRHDSNLEIVEQNDGSLYLSPIFDHGFSLGAAEKAELRSRVSIKEYNEEHNFSYFDDGHGQDLTGYAVFKKAAELRPKAAKIWLEQLSKINNQQIETIFKRLPSDRISPEASQFAQELLNYNQSQLLSLKKQLDIANQPLDVLYQRYAQNVDSLGLQRSKDIAQNALRDGVKPEKVAQILNNYDSSYQSLSRRNGGKKAQKLIIKKAQIDLALEGSSQQELSQQRSFLPNVQSPSVSQRSYPQTQEKSKDRGLEL